MLTVYKKIPVWAILIVVVYSLFLTSCNQTISDEKCTLSFSINSNNLLDKSRDIVPLHDLDLISSYKLTLNGPSDEKKEIKLTSSSGTIENLSVGYWTIVVEALNSIDNVIATGNSVIYLTKQTNNIDIKLEQLEGQGKLVLSFIWDEDKVIKGQTRVDCTIASEDGTIVNKKNYSFDSDYDLQDNSGTTLLINNLDAGSYIISAKLISNNICLSGIVEPIRIVNSAESEGVITFIIGDKANHFTFHINNNIMLPISGTIEISNKKTFVNEDFTLTFTADELPTRIDKSTLTYQWYCEGEIIPGATSNVITTRNTLGSHRYDIIVKSTRKGSTGGTTITVETINPQ